MERNEASSLISANLNSLFAFSLSRLFDKSQAEDLTHEIVCEVLKSAPNLRNEKAFFGFMWKIAENTFKRFIRNKSKSETGLDEAVIIGSFLNTPEMEYCADEELNLLRRELSLMSAQYREVTIEYYINGKSCVEISELFGVSQEMVKYYLFKTRKILKEGIAMNREFGEKSYNPSVFRMDYWGGGNNARYWKIFERKLPGNIILATYYSPLTIRELSSELGVAAPYLEDELEILIRDELLIKKGDKYQSNIIVFTDECEKEVAAVIKPICEEAAKKAGETLHGILPMLADISAFKTYSNGRKLWAIANIAVVGALNIADSISRERFGGYPPLTNGSYGFVFGYDNNYVNHHFNGIYGYCENTEKTARFTVVNYRVIEKIQNWEPGNWEQSVEAINDAIIGKEVDIKNPMIAEYIAEGFISNINGRINANIPVFKSQDFYMLSEELLVMVRDIIKDAILKSCSTAESIVKNHAPKTLHDKCGQLSAIHYQMDSMAFVIEAMLSYGYLPELKQGEIACMYGIKNL